MRQQQKDEKKPIETESRIADPRDEERQFTRAFAETADDENPCICRGID